MSRLLTRDEQRQAGESARAALPLSVHAGWTPGPGRPDPVGLLEEQAASRVPGLVPIRHGRMAVSPFSYYRGAALAMAADLATMPASGIVVQLCGDAHLSNFGLFASPERDLLFDVNDFDETLLGPFEWDVKRLAASIVVAGRERGFGDHASRHAAHLAVRSYQDRVAEYASMRTLDVYYARVDVAAVIAYVDKRARPFLRTTVRSASHHDALHELPKLTAVDAGGHRRIVDNPPIISHPADLHNDRVAAVLADYRSSLQEDRRVLLDRYQLEDVALKVVGVGSVGLYAFAALFLGSDDDDPLFLQVKQAEASVLERFLPPSREPSHGARVVAGQRRLQAAGDVLLGWAVGRGDRHWYFRQLQDQKGSAVVDAMALEDLETWGRLCGWALARGHARSGRPAELAGYLGTGREFERAIGEFAVAYADQTERDFEAFTAAIRSGRLAAEPGV
ncbi:MAG: hypothetical protein H6Q36_836 [Chloroflexi bacterium]|nr:hypothetical protein [Chloroflexota bacterium]